MGKCSCKLVLGKVKALTIPVQARIKIGDIVAINAHEKKDNML